MLKAWRDICFWRWNAGVDGYRVRKSTGVCESWWLGGHLHGEGSPSGEAGWTRWEECRDVIALRRRRSLRHFGAVDHESWEQWEQAASRWIHWRDWHGKRWEKASSEVGTYRAARHASAGDDILLSFDSYSYSFTAKTTKFPNGCQHDTPERLRKMHQICNAQGANALVQIGGPCPAGKIFPLFHLGVVV